MKKNRIRLSESQLHKVIKESVKKTLMEVNRFDTSFYGGNSGDIHYFNRKTNFDGTDFLDPDNNDVFDNMYKVHCEICDLQERLSDYGQHIKKNGATEGQLNKLRALYRVVNNMYENSQKVLDMYNGGFYSWNNDPDIPKQNYGNWYQHNNIDPD